MKNHKWLIVFCEECGAEKKDVIKTKNGKQKTISCDDYKSMKDY